MADKNLNIKLKTQGTKTAEKEFKKVSSSIGSVAKSALGGVASLYALKKGFNVTVKAAAEQEKIFKSFLGKIRAINIKMFFPIFYFPRNYIFLFVFINPQKQNNFVVYHKNPFIIFTMNYIYLCCFYHGRLLFVFSILSASGRFCGQINIFKAETQLYLRYN